MKLITITYFIMFGFATWAKNKTNHCPIYSQEKSSHQNDITFIAFGDSQYAKGSWDKNQKHIKAINSIAGRLNWHNSKQKINAIRGVIMAGDITQYAKGYELQNFNNDYGLCGEKKLHYKMYEGFGNHDSKYENDLSVVKFVAKRNKYRSKHYTKNGHYSWNWQSKENKINFIQLNLVAVNGMSYNSIHKRNFNALGALKFLQQQLKRIPQQEKIIIVMHYGFLSGWDFPKWWSRKDALIFKKLLQEHRITAIIHGHAHHTNVYRWQGYRVINVGSPFYKTYNQDQRGHFTIFRIKKNILQIQDYAWDPKDSANVHKSKSLFYYEFRI